MNYVDDFDDGDGLLLQVAVQVVHLVRVVSMESKLEKLATHKYQ
jgi:hypothetical protein